jgi:hypothetical protein
LFQIPKKKGSRSHERERDLNYRFNDVIPTPLIKKNGTGENIDKGRKKFEEK